MTRLSKLSRSLDSRVAVADVREALAVPPLVPMTYCDARQRNSTRDTLIELVQYALLQATA